MLLDRLGAVSLSFVTNIPLYIIQNNTHAKQKVSKRKSESFCPLRGPQLQRTSKRQPPRNKYTTIETLNKYTANETSNKYTAIETSNKYTANETLRYNMLFQSKIQ